MPGEVAALMISLDCPEEGGEPARLLERARAGDAEAFEAILRLHERRVLRTALRLLGCLEDAQDASQEVFLRLHRHLRSFDSLREFAPWLYRITVNVCHDVARKRRPALSLDQAAPGELSEPPADPVSAEQRRLLLGALKRLPERERVALVLRDLEGMDTAEVALIMNTAQATVRSHIAAARLKLRKLLGEAGCR